MKVPYRETPVDLWLWFQDGAVWSGNVDLQTGKPYQKPPKWPRVEIGRTDSKRRLGFAVKMTARSEWVLFTLDKAQVKHLHYYLGNQLRRLKGRKP